MSTLSVLKDARVHEIYERASKVLLSRGISKSLVYDPYTKRVDIMGAILLACGASEKRLKEGFNEPEDTDVPPVNHGKVRVAYDFVESYLGQDPSEWCATHTTHEAVAVLSRLSERIEISVRIPESLTQTTTVVQSLSES